MSGPPTADDAGPGVRVAAPAKLTLSLRVEGRRSDGFHDLSAEMVALDLADVLWIHPGSDGLVVEAAPGSRAGALSVGPDNLVNRALRVVDRHAAVRLRKQVPVGGGLGGGSTDAAAVLRWAGRREAALAASLGADVPFCVVGGRAMVRGLGERVVPLPFERRSFVLLVPPFGVDTGAVYRAWDRMEGAERRARVPEGAEAAPYNDLTTAALAVEPRLRRWRDELRAVTGREPMLAGSGSTWFVEGDPRDLGLGGASTLEVGDDAALVLAVRTVPPGWEGSSSDG